MDNLILKMGTIFIVLVLMIFSTQAIASEGEAEYQGRITNIDFRQNAMVVNERACTWDQTTAVFNAKGVPIALDRLKEKAWVYIKGVRNNNSLRIKKIYLLPRQILRKERHLHPFMDE